MKERKKERLTDKKQKMSENNVRKEELKRKVRGVKFV